MKVIAHTSEYTVFVEASLDELAQIEGMRGSWNLPIERKSYDGGAKSSISYPIGRQIEIDKLWKIIEAERARPGAISSAAKNLHALAELLETINETLPTPAIEQPASEQARA